MASFASAPRSRAANTTLNVKSGLALDPSMQLAMSYDLNVVPAATSDIVFTKAGNYANNQCVEYRFDHRLIDVERRFQLLDGNRGRSVRRQQRYLRGSLQSDLYRRSIYLNCVCPVQIRDV